MTIVVRKFAASPERTAAETWKAIIQMLDPSDTKWLSELNGVTGSLSSIIASQAPKDAPLIIRGNGPLLRIYCLYDDEAVIGEDKKEQSLNWEPLTGDWKMYAPCPTELLEQMSTFISKRATRIELYDENEEPDFSGKASDRIESFTIDLDALRDA